MSAFDTVHTTSYSTLIETMRLSCIGPTVFELQRVICQLGLPRLNFEEIFGVRKLECLRYRVVLRA